MPGGQSPSTARLDVVGGVALTLGVLALLTAALPWLTQRIMWPNGVSILIGSTAGLYFTAFALCRFGHSTAARRLIVATVLIGVWGPTLLPLGIDPFGGHRTFVISGVLVAAAMLRGRGTLAISAFTLLGLLYVYATTRSYGVEPFIEDLLVIGSASAFITVVAYLRDHDQDRLASRSNELEQALAEMRALLESSDAAIILLDRRGHILALNATAADWAWNWYGMRLAPGDAFMDSLQVGVPAEGQRDMQRLIDNARAGRTMTLERTLPTAAGDITIESTVGPVSYGSQVQGVAIHARDVTERRRAEDARREAFEAALELDKLRDQDRFRAQLLNTAGHELRTPLTPLRLLVRLLRSGRRGELTEQQATDLDVIERNLGRLSRLIDDLLDLSRIEGGALGLRPRRFDLAVLVQEEAAPFATLGDEKGLAFRVDAHAADIVADRDRIGQVLANLFSNAVKFTPHGGVQVKVRVDDDAVVTVQDTGVGIPPHRLQELFRPFHRLHDEEEGTGLGLYIARGIVQAHGGTLEAESTGPGKGTRFTLRLPLAAAKAEAPRPKRPAQG